MTNHAELTNPNSCLADFRDKYGNRLVTNGEFEGKSAKEINEEFVAAVSDKRFCYGHTPGYFKEGISLATQAFVIGQYHRCMPEEWKAV